MNTTVLSAQILERGALRTTPAGLPALDLKLMHESEVVEAGSRRLIYAQIKAKAIGVVAQRLDRQTAGSEWQFSGFLSSPGSAHSDLTRPRSVVLHILDFQPHPISSKVSPH